MDETRPINKIGYWQSPKGLTQYPDPTHPKMIDPSWLGSERCKLVNYLRSGKAVFATMGYSYCRFRCGIDCSKMGCQDLTDGVWCWPEGLAHYIESLDVVLPEQFVDFARSNDLIIPAKIDWLSSRSIGSKFFLNPSGMDFWLKWYEDLITIYSL